MKNIEFKKNLDKLVVHKIQWLIICFVTTTINFLFGLCIVLFGPNKSSVATTIGLVYGGFLPTAIISVILILLNILIFYHEQKNKFWKLWQIYLLIFCVLNLAIVLPIPLHFLTKNISNAGILWSVVVFVFFNLFATMTIFLYEYKLTINNYLEIIDKVPNNEDAQETKNNETSETQVTDPTSNSIQKQNEETSNNEQVL